MALKLRRTRKLGLAVVLMAVMILAACDTQPATDVSYQAATLNAKGACIAGTSGHWWYQIRPVGGTFYDVGPAHSYGCGSNTGEVNLTAERVNGLQPDTTYQFRIRSTVNGGNYTYDANGAQGGTSFDSFRTPSVLRGEEVYSPPPVESREPCTGDACASNHLRRKDDLKTTYRSWFRADIVPDFEWWGIRVTTDWGYIVPSNGIRWRSSDPSYWISSPIGDVSKTYSAWHTSRCFTGGMDTCLTRYEAQFRMKATVYTPLGPIYFNTYQWGCAATRINGDGGWSKNAWGANCSNAPSGSTARASNPNPNPTTAQKLGESEGEPGVGIESYVGPRMRQRIKEACWRRPESINSDECQRVLLEAWNSLTAAEKRKVRADAAPSACVALSTDSLNSLSPGSECARRALRRSAS